MKILVFEFVCAGGIADQALSASLAVEGRLMLEAVIADLYDAYHSHLTIIADPRWLNRHNYPNCHYIWNDHLDFWQQLDRAIQDSDAVLPIAPEEGLILHRIAIKVKQAGKALWLSDPDTVRLCSFKQQTTDCLHAWGMPVVPSQSYTPELWPDSGIWILKPDARQACEGIFIVDANQVQQAPILDDYLLQPFIKGDTLSLSLVFFDGKGHVLSVNKQLMAWTESGCRLQGCVVNIDHQLDAKIATIIAGLAKALPGLWGYIGIDVVLTEEHELLILEINPRLTTSYTALYEATGIAVYRQLCHDALQDSVSFAPVWHKTITITL